MNSTNGKIVNKTLKIQYYKLNKEKFKAYKIFIFYKIIIKKISMNNNKKTK